MNVNDMVRGLVRCAELRERDGGGDLWDDESRAALAAARARGWGKGYTGHLLEPRAPRSLEAQVAEERQEDDREDG